MEEKWLPVAGFEGHYEVSDQCRVRSVPRLDNLGRKWQGKLLKTCQASGRRRVNFSKDGKVTSHAVHTLVLQTHRGMELAPPSPLRDICPAGHPLEEPNLVPARAAEGHRICLACSRARATVQRLHDRGLDGNFQVIADGHLRSILTLK